MIGYYDIAKSEIDGLYADDILQDISNTIRLYSYYDGEGQKWGTSEDMDYKPTVKRTNYIKKLIKEEARFLFGKTPEYSIECASKEESKELLGYLNKVLMDNMFSDKLLKGARDCFIGKRVALKVGCVNGKDISISFRPAMEFIYEVAEDNIDLLKKVVFFYAVNDCSEKSDQRIWKQKYEMVNEKCILNEGIYDGYGQLLEKVFVDTDTGLGFIPVIVIINDGLSGDLKGESDVEELIEIQEAYNRLSSDDIDALRFNMFPQTVAVDASEKSLENIVIAPSALIDLQTEITAGEGRSATITKLESGFNYDPRLENVLNRLKNEMYELLNIPNVTPSELKGYITSGKSMKALYWQMITRCEEKYAVWRPALTWLGETILKMSEIYGVERIDGLPVDMTISVENLYPLMEDEYEEKTMDMQEVEAGLMSKEYYTDKWRDKNGKLSQSLKREDLEERDRGERDKEIRDKGIRDKEIRDKEIRDREIRDKKQEIKK